MKSKYVMVPLELYRSLTSGPPKSELDETKQKMNDIMEDKNLDDSTKNILYGQELQNYLKIKKEHEERPILVDQIRRKRKSSMHIQPAFPLYLGSNIPPSPPPGPGGRPVLRAKRRRRDGGHGGSPSPARRRSASPSPPRRTPPLDEEEEQQEEEEQEEYRTPSQSPTRRQRRSNEMTLDQKLDELVDDIMTLVEEYRDEIGITPDGKILNLSTRRPFSDRTTARDAVYAFLGSPKHNPNSPGFQQFRTRLLSKPRINIMFETAIKELNHMRGRPHGGPSTSRHQRGHGTSRSQRGSGRRVRKPNGRVYKNCRYKLERWICY